MNLRAWALSTACLLLPGCLLFAGRNWEETRRTCIEPINSALHRHLGKDIKEKKLDAVVGAFAVETGTGIGWERSTTVPFGAQQLVEWHGSAEEPIRERYARLLDVFAKIDRAEVRIHRVYWYQGNPPDGFPAEIRTIVRGVGADGAARTVDQRARVTIAQRDGRWVIASDEIVKRQMVVTTKPSFEVATEKSKINDVHDTTGAPIFRLIGDVTISSGSAVADVDCDGLEDLLLVSGSKVATYRNRGDGTFADVSQTMGIAPGADIAATGIVTFDADNDGDPDAWLSGIRGDRFFTNESCARFADATDKAGIGPSRWSSMPSVADYDRDGYLDVYVTRMGDHVDKVPEPSWDAANGEGDSLYRNNGDGTFTDVAKAAGIHRRGWGLAAAWSDYDEDGDPDIYVGNEYGTNSLYRNNGDGTFTDVAAAAGVLDRGACMGLTWGDFDNDGHLDLFISNMYANSRWVLVHPDFPSPVPWYYSWVPRSDVDVITDALTRGNTLLRNNGNGTFTDVSERAGVRDCQWAYGSEFLDYDNDGWLDVYVANGFISGHIPDDV